MSYNIDTVHDYGNLPFAADDSLKESGGRFVTINSDGQVSLADAGTAADGTLRAGVTEGFSPVVTTSGAWAYVVPEDGADLSYGDAVAVGDNAGAAATTTDDSVMGYVVELANADSNMVRIKLTDGSATAA